MSIIKLPIDTKSLYFNIKNDNLNGHTATVASPLRKTLGNQKLVDILKINEKEIDINTKKELISLLVKHSKTKVLIKNVFVFDKLSVNGKNLDTKYCFGCYVKEEIDDSKVQFGRLKLHYPSKFIYEDYDMVINNKMVYKSISDKLNNYAFIIRSFEYDTDKKILNFDALIVGENDIPYSKVFINEKGVGSKFNHIFNENADDYDREIIALRKQYGIEVNPYNYLDYFKKLREKASDLISNYLNKKIENISIQFPYSLFDFCYDENGVKKYGILRVTATKNKYFNISFIQQLFLMNNSDESCVYLVYDIFDNPSINVYKYEDLSNLSMNINSIKYEEE